MYGVSKPFSDTCYSHGNIPLRVEGYLDLARMRRYTVVFLSKTQGVDMLACSGRGCSPLQISRKSEFCVNKSRNLKLGREGERGNLAV